MGTLSRIEGVLLLSASLAWPAQAQEMCSTCAVPSIQSTEKARVEDSRAEELKRVDAELDNAWLRGDKAAVAEVLAAGMISIDSSGEVTAREKLLERVRPSPAALKTSVIAADIGTMFFGDTAILTAQKTRKWERRGRPHSRDYRETNTYVRRDGRWLLISSQDSVEPPYFARDVAFDLPFDERFALGDKNAGIVLYEFSDYQCPFCRRFSAQTMNRIVREYVQTGKAALVYRDYPLEDSHPRAFAAAVAAQCAASNGKFWEMNERLLRDPVALADEDFARNAQEIGIAAAAFGGCVRDPQTAQKIRVGMKEAETFGIEGTPIFVIGIRKPGDSTVRTLRMIEGAFPYEVFKTTLDGVIRSRSL